MGYSCMALDQRSGEQVNGVINRTAKEAKKRGWAQEYTDAIPDIETAISFLQVEVNAKKIILWGSSYSAALTFYFASQHPEINAVVAFSPGEYFKVEGKGMAECAAEVNCPVFISSAKSEEDKWRNIYDALPGEKQYYLPEEEGFHGSRALWSSKKGHDQVWSALSLYLETLEL